MRPEIAAEVEVDREPPVGCEWGKWYDSIFPKYDDARDGMVAIKGALLLYEDDNTFVVSIPRGDDPHIQQFRRQPSGRAITRSAEASI